MRLHGKIGAAALTLLTACVLALAAGANPAQASASTEAGAPTDSARASTVTLADDPAKPRKAASNPGARQDACYLTVGAYRGELACHTVTLWYQWSDGHWEVFDIGTDGVLYHIWQRYPGDSAWSGWHSLGGYQLADGVWLWDNTPTVSVLGGNGAYYCKRWQGSFWGGWLVC